DRFAKVEGMHVVPPPMTGIYMPPNSNFGIDNVETLEYVPKPVESKPKAINEPKVWSDAPIIEEYESDSDDEYVIKALVEQEKPSCAFIYTVKHVKTPRQTVKDQDTCSQNPKVPNRDWTDLMSKRLGLGYGYTRKACFVCGSFGHLIRDCDFHEKRMAKQVKLNKSKNKDNPHQTLKGKRIVDSGCSSKGQITSKGKIKTRELDFKDVYFVKELQHFNLFSVSQMYEKKNKVLFTDTECLVLSPDFKLPDENQVLLRVPRQNNMYNFNLENIIPSKGLACLVAKATVDESNKWDQEEYSNARTPQQNGVAERKNRTLIEATLTVKSLEAKNGDEKLNANIGSKTNEEPVDQEDQAFLGFAFQAGAARASSTNNVNTASTPVNIASTPVNIASTLVPTASPSRNVSTAGPSYPGLSTNSNQDDSQIPSLKDIYEVPSDGIFTSSSYDDEGAVANFINLESTVNVSPIPQSKIHSIHPTTQILGDPTSAVQTRSKVNKSLGAHAFVSYIQKQRRFIDPKFPKKVYKVVKALYGLHQALRAWYATLSTFLLQSGYRKGLIDKTLFIKKDTKDIMLVTPKTSHLHAMKRIFMYLKGRLKLGLRYPRESAFDLEAYSDSDYARANLDKKSTTRGCQFLGKRLISW
nr:ribonuclease H-like domain-containing protein [Tanacetum cinerariifolium]